MPKRFTVEISEVASGSGGFLSGVFWVGVLVLMTWGISALGLIGVFAK